MHSRGAAVAHLGIGSDSCSSAMRRIAARKPGLRPACTPGQSPCGDASVPASPLTADFRKVAEQLQRLGVGEGADVLHRLAMDHAANRELDNFS